MKEYGTNERTNRISQQKNENYFLKNQTQTLQLKSAVTAIKTHSVFEETGNEKAGTRTREQ